MLSAYLADWEEAYRAVGDPWDVADDSAWVPVPPQLPGLQVMFGMCLFGAHDEEVGRFRFFDEEVRLPDGPTTGERWRAEKRRSVRHRWFCESCGCETQWVSLGVSSQRALDRLKRNRRVA